MARQKTEELTKHTLNLRAGDMDAIRELFPARECSVIVRKLVSRFVDTTRQSATKTTLPDIDIGD